MASDDLAGALLEGRYRVAERIGSGGMASVFRARQLSVDRDVAVKVLERERSENPELVRRFEDEARIISRLRHPNTLKLIDFGRAPDGRLYLVSELLEGEPLSAALAKGPLEAARVVKILAQIAGSLEEAHAQGVLHRDLKPANIFLERMGGQEIAKVLDFGIATLGADRAAAPSSRDFGTARYMSPEQARRSALDGRSDLYSLGVVAYEALTGRPPFTGEPAAVMLHHQLDAPEPIERLRPEVPLPLARLVHRLLAKDPASRPADAAVLRRELESLSLASRAVEVDRSPEEPEPEPDPDPDRDLDPIRERARKRASGDRWRTVMVLWRAIAVLLVCGWLVYSKVSARKSTPAPKAPVTSSVSGGSTR